MRPVYGISRALVTAAAMAAASTLVVAQTAHFETLHVRGLVSMVTNGSSNVLLQSGPQGMLLVDTLLEPDGARLVDVVRSRGGSKPIRYVVNTHADRSEEHTSELQSQSNLVCRLLLEKK